MTEESKMVSVRSPDGSIILLELVPSARAYQTTHDKLHAWQTAVDVDGNVYRKTAGGFVNDAGVLFPLVNAEE